MKATKATHRTTRITSKLSRILGGVAGEYFVAAELSRRGWIASLTLKNTRGVDILVANKDASRSATIQCKTNQSKRKDWQLNKECEYFYSDSHFYVFVNLGALDELPSYHIVPSQVVAEHIQYHHGRWLKRLKGPVPKYAEKMRRYSDRGNRYLGAWVELERWLDDTPNNSFNRSTS